MKPPTFSLWLAAITCTSAAPITWDLPANTSSKADLIEGTVVTALNGGNANLTINDAGASGTSSYTFTTSNYTTINFTPTGGDAGDSARAGFGTNQYAPSTMTTTGDAPFDSLVSTVTYAFGTPSGIVTGDMLLEGLSIGTEYQVQVFFNDQRSTADTRAMTYGDGEGNTVLVAGGDATVGVQLDHYGQFVVGTFTADAETQFLTMDSSMGPTPFGNIHYNAIIVTGPEELNVPPQLADAAFDLPDASPIGTLVATLVATDGNVDDDLSYTITAGDPDNVFTLDSESGELRTAKAIDINTTPVYNLTVEVSDTIETDTAAIDINVFIPAGDAVITWSPAQNTSSVADLVPGTPVFARNGGANPVTVAGTEFQSLSLGTGFSGAYPGGITSTGDPEFDALISEFSFGGGAGTVELPGHITGLTPGTQYTIQVFFTDQRAAQSGRIMTFSDSHGNAVDVGAGATLGTGEADDYGQFAIGTFTANATTQILQLAPGGIGFGNSHYTAILVVEGTGTLRDPSITDISFNPASNEVSVTWTSDPGRTYALFYSTDLLDFSSDINDSIPAGAEDTTTSTFVLPAGLIGIDKVFFRVVPN